MAHGRGPVLQPALTVTDITDTTCAGDTYFGSFLSIYATGGSIDQAMCLASAAAFLTIQKPGASVSIPTLAEVRALL